MIDVILRAKKRTNELQREANTEESAASKTERGGEKRNARRHTLSDFHSRSPSVRFLPISSSFLIRAIFPGRSHVNFRRPMTRQVRGAQTSMIFRVFRERVERAKFPIGRTTDPSILRQRRHPLSSSISIRANVVPHHDGSITGKYIVQYEYNILYKNKKRRG